MTTSGVTTSTMLAQEVVQAAMQELGVLSAGESPTAEELLVGIRSLNFMLKGFQARGANLWRAETDSLTIPANTAFIALPQHVLDVVSLRVVVSASYERETHRYERGQYAQLPNKLTPGTPTIYYVDRQRDAAVLYVWPVPQINTPVLYEATRIIEDVTDGTQTLDVPQEWLETVYIALAARLAISFGVARVDPTAANIMQQRAASLEQLMFDADRPSSIFMGPQGGRNF